LSHYLSIINCLLSGLTIILASHPRAFSNIPILCRKAIHETQHAETNFLTIRPIGCLGIRKYSLIETRNVTIYNHSSTSTGQVTL